MNKSKLRRGEQALGSGMARQAAGLISGRQRQIDDAVDAASGAPSRPAVASEDENRRRKRPAQRSALRTMD